MKRLLIIGCILSACSSSAPRHLDDLLDTPVQTVERRYGPGSYFRCYELPGSRFLTLGVDDEDPSRFWSIELADSSGCETAMPPNIEVPTTFKIGVNLGDSVEKVLAVLGQPDSILTKAPDGSSAETLARFTQLGGTEYVFDCKKPPTCSWVTSVFARGGKVSAISIWYTD